MLTFDLPKICIFLQNGGVGRSKVNIGRSKVNTLFFQQKQVGQRSPPSMQGGDLWPTSNAYLCRTERFWKRKVGQRSTQVGQRSPNRCFLAKIIWHYNFQEKQLGRSKVTTHPIFSTEGSFGFRAYLKRSDFALAFGRPLVDLERRSGSHGLQSLGLWGDGLRPWRP